MVGVGVGDGSDGIGGGETGPGEGAYGGGGGSVSRPVPSGFARSSNAVSDSRVRNFMGGS